MSGLLRSKLKLSFCTVLFVTVSSFCSKLAVYKSKFNDRVTVRFVVTVECFKNTAQYKMHFFPRIVSQNKCNILKCIVAPSKYTTYLWKLVCWFVLLRHKHLTLSLWKKMHQLLLAACNRKRSHVMTVFMWSRQRSSQPNVTKTYLFPQFTRDSIQASMHFLSVLLSMLFCLVRSPVHSWCILDQFGLAVNFKSNHTAVNLSLYTTDWCEEYIRERCEAYQ